MNAYFWADKIIGAAIIVGAVCLAHSDSTWGSAIAGCLLAVIGTVIWQRAGRVTKKTE